MSILDFIQAGEEEQEPISALPASMAPPESDSDSDSDSDSETHKTMAKIGPKAAKKYTKDNRFSKEHQESALLDAFTREKEARENRDTFTKSESNSGVKSYTFVNEMPGYEDWKNTSFTAKDIRDHFEDKRAKQKQKRQASRDKIRRNILARKYAKKVQDNMEDALELWSQGKTLVGQKFTTLKKKKKTFHNRTFQAVYNAAEKCISKVVEKILLYGARFLDKYDGEDKKEIIYPLIQFRCLIALGHDIYANFSLFEDEYESIYKEIDKSKYKTLTANFFGVVDDAIRLFAFFKDSSMFKYRYDIGFVNPDTGENKPRPPFKFQGDEYRVWQPLPSGILHGGYGTIRDKLIRGYTDKKNEHKFMFDVFYGLGSGYNEWYKVDANFDQIKKKAEEEGYALDEVVFDDRYFGPGENQIRFRLRPLRPNTQAERKAQFQRDFTTIKRANRGNKEQLQKLDEEYRQKVKHEGISDDEDEEGVILEETENVQVGDERNGYKVTEIFYNENGDQIINWEEIKDEDDLAYYNEEGMQVEKKINLRTRVQIGMSMSKRRAPTRPDRVRPTTPDRVLDVNEDLASLIDMMIL